MTTHAVVPAEYLSLDYGFSAIDESTIRPLEPTTTTDIAPSQDE